MFDCDLKYCPECRDEYRADISVCASCQISLISGEQMLKRAEEITREMGPLRKIDADETLLPLQRGNLLDMKRLKQLLAEHHIPALLVKDEQCRSGCCGGGEVTLQICQDDGERAAVVLQEEYERTTGYTFRENEAGEYIFNPEASKAVCPACGSSFGPNGPDCPDCGLCFV